MKLLVSHFLVLLLSLFVFPVLSNAQGCASLSVCFVIDESNSITYSEFNQQISVVTNLSNEISIFSESPSYFSAVAYADIATTISKATTDLSEFHDVLRRYGRGDGATHIGKGMLKCAELQDELTAYQRIIVVITDGKDNGIRVNRAPRVSKQLKKSGFIVASLGIGAEYSENVLKNIISSDPSLSTDIQTFPELIGALQQFLCPSPTPSATPSSSISTTPTSSISPSSSVSLSMTPTPSISVTATATASATSSSTSAPMVSASPTMSVSTTSSMSATPSVSMTPAFAPCDTVNICYAVDETSSISAAQFILQTDAIVNLTLGIAQRSPDSKFSACGFATTTSIISSLTDNISSFVSAMRSNVPLTGSTASGLGLQQCASILLADVTSSTRPKLIVLVTDGVDNREPNGLSIAPGLKNQGFILSTLGIGLLAPRNVLQNIASTDSLFNIADTFEDLPNAVPNVVSKYCSLPAPAPASPTPSITPTPRPLGFPRVTNENDLPVFNPDATREEIADIIGITLEFYIWEQLPAGALIRVEVTLVDMSSDLFPWNILQGDYLNNPNAPPSPTPWNFFSNSGRKLETTTQHENKLTDTTATDRLILGCRTNNCAVHIQVWSDRFIRWVIIRNALIKLQRRPGFSSIAGKDRSKFRIAKRKKRHYSVFVPLIDRREF